MEAADVERIQGQEYVVLRAERGEAYSLVDSGLARLVGRHY